MPQHRYGSVGGEVKVAARAGVGAGLLESGEGVSERGADVFGFKNGEHVVQVPDLFFLVALVGPAADRRVVASRTP